MVGTFLHVYKCSGRYLATYEEDFALFDAIRSPLRGAKPIASSGFMSQGAYIESNVEHVKKVARKNRWST